MTINRCKEAITEDGFWTNNNIDTIKYVVIRLFQHYSEVEGSLQWFLDNYVDKKYTQKCYDIFTDICNNKVIDNFSEKILYDNMRADALEILNRMNIK